jgi:ribosomal protein S8
MENLFSKISYGYKQSKIYINVKNTKITITLLDLLIKEGFILRYKVEKNNIQIYLKYNQLKMPAIKLLDIISKPKKKVFINVHQLRGLIYKYPTSTFFLATTQGLVTQIEALELNIAGKLLFKIN